jgi:hypothetical protein
MVAVMQSLAVRKDFSGIEPALFFFRKAGIHWGSQEAALTTH